MANIPISTKDEWWYDRVDFKDLARYWAAKLEIWKRNVAAWNYSS